MRRLNGQKSRVFADALDASRKTSDVQLVANRPTPWFMVTERILTYGLGQRRVWREEQKSVERNSIRESQVKSCLQNYGIKGITGGQSRARLITSATPRLIRYD